MESILKIEKIEKYYGNKSSLTKAIDNISFEVKTGEFVAIMGANNTFKLHIYNRQSNIRSYLCSRRRYNKTKRK